MANIDLDNLITEFNLSTEVDPKEEPKKIKPKDGLKSSESVTMDLKPVDVNNPDEIVSSNVSKANAILEHIMKEMVAGNFSPRMAEVASLIINNVNVIRLRFTPIDTIWQILI